MENVALIWYNQRTVSSAFLKGELQICPKSAKIKKEGF